MNFWGIRIALILCGGNCNNETMKRAQMEMIHQPNSSSQYIVMAKKKCHVAVLLFQRNFRACSANIMQTEF